MVVLDPGHGGTDTGARGASGAIEKDVVLAWAKAIRDELQRQGFQVVLTREGDTNPSFDDRAAVANAQRGAIFLSLHAGSTGPTGTVRSYSYLFSTAPESPPPSSAQGTPKPASLAPPATAAPAAPPGFLLWGEAQKPYAALSHQLADFVQAELAKSFTGSPQVSTTAAVRVLRSVAAPAAAIEVSSVSVPNPKMLDAFAAPLASAIARAVQAFKAVYESGGP